MNNIFINLLNDNPAPKVPRTINLIVIHCSATRVDRDFTAADVDAAHRFRGFRCAGYHYYIRKSGVVEPMRPEYMIGAHAKGFNAHSIGICYEGGLNPQGEPYDTRTLEQRLAMHKLVHSLWLRYPDARVVGHRDLSPDINHDGIISPRERIKECPCFDAIPEMKHFR